MAVVSTDFSSKFTVSVDFFVLNNQQLQVVQMDLVWVHVRVANDFTKLFIQLLQFKVQFPSTLFLCGEVGNGFERAAEGSPIVVLSRSFMARCISWTGRGLSMGQTGVFNSFYHSRLYQLNS